MAHTASSVTDRAPVRCCSWYKTKDADGKIFNDHNTAPSYHAQRLFLASGRERNIRLIGSDKMFGGTNSILANKRGVNADGSF